MTTSGDEVRKGGAESVATGECAAWRTTRKCGIRGCAGDESANRNIGATFRHTHARTTHIETSDTHTSDDDEEQRRGGGGGGGGGDRTGPDSTASETWRRGGWDRMEWNALEVADEDRKRAGNGRRGGKPTMSVLRGGVQGER
ncbi:unnamed protein product [Angiostrongylus costaricensis]|uniref:Retrotransposon protein, putative, Ty3-gypsy subclass n=1 Tax=Angiostrongylus costaricensis TaxID=334426 RepID=A0A0R3PIT3_ANGCS|nr:unnamed protein product [Angiostrongylus costaricensis]